MARKVTRKTVRKSSVEKKKSVSARKKIVSSSAKKSALEKISPGELSALAEKKAYELFERRGYVHGNDLGDWYEAEKAVMAGLKKK